MKNKASTPPSPATQHPEDLWVKSKSPDAVQGMFTAISPTYDALNHVFSMNIDKRWRKFLAGKTITPRVERILDVCGGTGDLALALADMATAMSLKPHIICSDFTPAMTVIAQKKFKQQRGVSRDIHPMIADTTALPFSDNSFDLVTVAFGIRNVVDPAAGLKEMARVTCPGGTLAVLEFSKTRNPLIDVGFKLYFTRILPLVGKLVTGTRAYSYLSKSVEQFPEGAEFCEMMSAATGAKTHATKLSFGIATLYISQKSK